MPPVDDITSDGFAAKHSRPWRRQPKTIWLLLLLLAGSSLWRYAACRYRVDDLLIGPHDQTPPLADKINPNSASWASLARLPGIGPARARAVVEYRQQHAQTHPGQTRAFTSCEDLQRIKGIGPATIQQIKDFLVFDDP